MTPRTEPVNNTADCWWKDPCLRRNVAHIVICYLAIYSLGYDGSLLNGLQALPTWNRDFVRLWSLFFLTTVPTTP